MRHSKKLSLLTSIGMLCFFLMPVQSVSQTVAESRSTAKQRESTSITVYNSNLGLVREIRSLNLPVGMVSLKFMDVASQIKPETVLIKSLGDAESLAVLEQNYEYDLLSPQKMLDKYVGRMVKVIRRNEKTGKDEEQEAEVLSTNGGTILKIGDEITFNYPGRIVFPKVPENLISKPTLVWLLQNERPHQLIETTYLTGGMTWKADYVLVVNAQDNRGDIKGWVTLNNTSGTAYEHAKLKLVAGELHRAEVPRARGLRREMVFKSARADRDMKEESFFEYHLYTLTRPTTLKNNSQKQVSLLEASKIKIEKHLIFHGQSYYFRGSYGQVVSNQKVGVYLDIPNKKEYGMGMPLPKGVVRVYKADSSGALQFIGEDRIDHTPKDEKLRIKMGEAFDVVADRKQTDYKIVSTCVSESAWEISLRNHKEEYAEVEVYEPAAAEWKILSSSHPYTKEDAQTFSFKVKVPKNGETKITYRVRVRWCR